MRQRRSRRIRWLGPAALAVVGAIGVGTAPTLVAAVSNGTLEVHKGGYRDTAVTTNSPDGYAKALAGAGMEYATTGNFASPVAFPSLTDASGVATASVPPLSSPSGYWVREKASPAGWQPIPTLEWGGGTNAYASTRTSVSSGGTSVAEASSDSVRFVNARTNPTIKTSCRTGLNVLMVLDTSGSTQGYESDYAAAGKAFVNQLAGTNTTLKIGHFATSSTPGTTPYDLSTPAGQNSAKATIDSIENAGGNGYTNWDAAMQDAAKAKVDVVVFITDGNPTVRVGATGTATSLLANVTYGIASANLAKNPDMTDATGDEQAILAVGVGGGIAVNNLKAISGNVAGKDYAVASNPGDLAALLKQLATTICPADLGIAKKGPDTIEPGNAINYDITVKNGGAVTIPFASIKVTDTDATTLVPPTPAPLAPGATLVWKATKAVASDEKLCNTKVSNTATVALVDLPGYTEPDLSNNTSTATTTVSCPLDVSIAKMATSSAVAPGGVATYDVTVTNTGSWTVPFSRIKISDPNAKLTPPADTSDLAKGASRTWKAEQTVGLDAKCGSTASNTATVSITDPVAAAATPVVDNHASTAFTPIVCPVAFSIEKGGDATVLPGGTIQYSIVVGNTGDFPIPFDAITVADKNAQDLKGPMDPPEFLAPGKTLEWTANHPVELTEKLCNTSVENTASVALADDIKGYDNPGGTQSSKFTTDVICPLQVGITKTSTNGPVAPGGTATYDVTVTNTGAWTVPFSAIKVDDPGAELTDPTDTTPLAKGDSRVWTATKLVPADAPCDIGTVSNTATVTLVKDQVPTALKANVALDQDNSSTATTRVECPVDLTVAKTTTSTSVQPGGTVPYSITVTNPSGFAVPFSAITVTDTGATITPPADTTALAPGASRVWTATKNAATGTTACGTTVANTAQVTLADLPSGYRAITPAGASSTATPVTISGGICDATVAAQGVVSAAGRATLSVRKVGPAIARRGSGVTYRIRVTNNSAVAATDVVVTDTPPGTLRIAGTSPSATRQGRTISWAIGDLAPGASRTVSVMLGVRATARGTTCNIASAVAGNADSASGRACTRVQAIRRVIVTG